MTEPDTRWLGLPSPYPAGPATLEPAHPGDAHPADVHPADEYATEGQHGSSHEPDTRSPLRRKLGALAAAAVAFLAKLKAILLVLGNIKIFATAGTMVVSVLAYATIWGFPFAAGFVVLLLVHELGHVIALRREGIPASAPLFIPFLGALISAKSLGENALAEARVGLAGPILGSIGSAACIVIWHVTGNDMWRALAFTGFFLNLFNLLPVVPLDGGRAMAAMAPWMWFLGFVGLIALAFVFPNPVILIIVVFAGFETYRRWQHRKAGDEAQQAYYKVAPLDRALVAAVYLSLVALLVVGMDATHLQRTFA
jgi:Zn-dependent protease